MMDFQQLYDGIKKNIKQVILRMWQDRAPGMIDMYRDQLDAILDSNISNNIVVEDMSLWESSDDNTAWRKCVHPEIWRKYKKDDYGDKTNVIEDIKFSPYKHQYKCWDTLLNKRKSIVVTTGTGSGKTECFMVPLIEDLAFRQDSNRSNAVEAIFLYPLNALMEDQKERMSDYITFSESNLTFAVYNGNTPETPEEQEDGELYPHEIGSRQQIRRDKPNILFTNPSMLEHMLLRKNDSELFSENLKWIVIDETHTFRGSAGAELALLLRRVLKACRINDVNQVRFATSSATIGNSLDALKKFITDITGQNDIEVITGQRTTPVALDHEKASMLHNKGFVYLNDLFPNESVETQLSKINNLTEQGLKVRLHFYIKALNRGLYIDLLDVNNSKFKLLGEITMRDNRAVPSVVNAYYCPQCGEVLGKCEFDEENREYHRFTHKISTLDDQIDDYNNDSDDANAENDEDLDHIFIAPYNEKYDDEDVDSCRATINGNIITDDEYGTYVYAKGMCPCCGMKDSKKAPLSSFHLSADYLSRIAAPKFIEQTTKHPKSRIVDLPSQGRKYITFVDSRQGAAGPSLKQNLETEKVWVIGLLYKELYKKNTNRAKLKAERDYLQNNQLPWDTTERLQKLNQELQDPTCYITWNDALKALLDDPNFDRMYHAFYVKGDSKHKYALAALYRVMHKRPGMGKNCPENWGLLATHYPQIVSGINRLPDAVESFNRLIHDDNLKIILEDWQDLIKIFVDYIIRTKESMFFKYSANVEQNDDNPWKYIDISSIRTFRTEIDSRTPITSVGNEARCSKLLCRLLGRDNYSDLTNEEKTAIDDVFKEISEALKTIGIAEISQSIDRDFEGKFKGWKSGDNDKFYLNLTNIAFKLYDDRVWFDNNLRIPLDVTFKRYSPYPAEDGRYNIVCQEVRWDRLEPTPPHQDIKEWFDGIRAEIAHKWTSELERILKYITSEYNTLYIQAENTAQVPRSIIKAKTNLFKGGNINIMACSTTMEMGVDLGDLELVVLNNIPPYPANYKQRAGRAGRGDQNRSACITFCGNDAIGLATMQRPLEELINREILPPSIELESVAKQLVQRHVNSFLLRTFAAIHDFDINRDTVLSDFFSKFIKREIRDDRRRQKFYSTENSGAPYLPDAYTDNNNILTHNTHDESLYHGFLEWLNDITTNDEYKNIETALNELIDHTSLANRDLNDIIDETKSAIIGVATGIHRELYSIHKQWNSVTDSRDGFPYRNGVDKYWKFVDALDKTMISYLANHQFTPNANMPVGIVELVTEKIESKWQKNENASRDLRTALAEYMPGNNVWINGRTYRVGGVMWNRDDHFKYVKQCGAGHRWTTNDTTCPKCGGAPINWTNFGSCMCLLTPIAYLSTGSVTRENRKDNRPSNIGVELIGAGNWEEQKGHRLYAYRTNEDVHNSKILYYDRGQHGYGYHICRKCGYCVAATSQYDTNDSEILIQQMYPIERTNSRGSHYFHSVLGELCEMTDDINDVISHNMVLGGEIQTDYCEVAIYRRINNIITEMPYNEASAKIGNTLGILLCRGLSKKLGCERGELDFITRGQDGVLSVCVFDIAKGGSGRSKQLPLHIISLLDEARQTLDECNTVEKILDKSTMKYADIIDVNSTLEWLNNELNCRQTPPVGMPDGVESSSFNELETAVLNNDTVTIFADGTTMDLWNYRDIHGGNSWAANRRRIRPQGASKFKMVVLNASNPISRANVELMDNIKSWSDLYAMRWDNEDYYPLAIVDNMLYITSKSEYARIDEKWAKDDIWRMPANSLNGQWDTIQWEPQSRVQTKNHRFSYKDKVSSKNLIDKVLEKTDCECLLKPFKGKEISLEYNDQYMSNPLASTIIIQAIQRVITLTGCSMYTLKVRTTYKSSGAECKETFKEAFPEIDFKVQDRDMPHDRSLKIVDAESNYSVSIAPDAGFGWGWVRDRSETDNPYGDNYNDDVKMLAIPKEGIKFNIESFDGTGN